LDLKIASLSKDADIVTTAREWATQIIERDPRLTLPEHQLLRERMIKQFKSKPNWAKVS
jgi:ATP-dependent DNA helicase RecG